MEENEVQLSEWIRKDLKPRSDFIVLFHLLPLKEEKEEAKGERKKKGEKKRYVLQKMTI